MKEAAKITSREDSLRLRVASSTDADALVRLINAAFRVELPYIEGDRIDAVGVRSYMAKGKFLVAEDSAGLAACVFVEKRADRGYLGLLGVDPSRQGTGLGLSMCYGTVKEHNGKIYAQNLEPHGAAVTIELPAA